MRKKLLTILIVLALIATPLLTIGYVPVNASDQSCTTGGIKAEVVFALDQVSATPGEEIVWTYLMRYGDEQSSKLHFQSTKRYDVLLLQDGNLIARWSDGMMFVKKETDLTLVRGDGISWNGTWQLPKTLLPGTYDVVFKIAATSCCDIDGQTTLIVRERPADEIFCLFKTDHLQYVTGSNVKLWYSITNTSDHAISLVFPTTEMFKWQLCDAHGRSVYVYSNDAFASDVPTTMVMPARSTKNFSCAWTVPSNILTGGYRFRVVLCAEGLPKTAISSAVLIKRITK